MGASHYTSRASGCMVDPRRASVQRRAVVLPGLPLALMILSTSQLR